MSVVNDQGPKTVNFILYEDEHWLDNVEVLNDDTTNYDFTGATAELIADATRPRTSTADLTFTTTTEITLTAGNVAIDGAHGLSVGTYEYDFNITVSSKVTTLFKGKIEVKANV